MTMAKLPDDRRSVFTDVYQYYEAHWDMPDTSEAWKGAAEQVEAISTKHGNSALAKRLLTACFDAIDDERRAIREMING